MFNCKIFIISFSILLVLEAKSQNIYVEPAVKSYTDTILHLDLGLNASKTASVYFYYNKGYLFEPFLNLSKNKFSIPISFGFSKNSENLVQTHYNINSKSIFYSAGICYQYSEYTNLGLKYSKVNMFESGKYTIRGDYYEDYIGVLYEDKFRFNFLSLMICHKLYIPKFSKRLFLRIEYGVWKKINFSKNPDPVFYPSIGYYNFPIYVQFGFAYTIARKQE